MGYKQFLADRKTQDAVARNIEVIGEAVRSLPDEFRSRHPDIPWVDIIGMRNTIIHKYFGILPDIVWDVIKTELPVLKQQVQGLIGESN
jgi:uncharacterized protein with HEPN domain